MPLECQQGLLGFHYSPAAGPGLSDTNDVQLHSGLLSLAPTQQVALGTLNPERYATHPEEALSAPLGAFPMDCSA